MDFEHIVAEQLTNLGYPIFYRNYKIYYNRRNLSEFDIVSDGFIVEVKSGRCYKTRGLNLMRSYNMLPKDYKYYIYCPMLSNEEIAWLNTGFMTETMCYINNYSRILANHKPCRDAVVTSESVLANVLNMRVEKINQFGKLYIHPRDFDHTILRINTFRNRYSPVDNMTWLDKLNMLVAQGRVDFTTPPPNTPLIIRDRCPLLSIKLNYLSPFVIPRVYYINVMQKDRTMVDIYHSRDDKKCRSVLFGY